MEFAISILIVVAASIWLGLRGWRFFAGASRPTEEGSPACTGCSGCGSEQKDPSCPVTLQARALEAKEKETVR